MRTQFVVLGEIEACVDGSPVDIGHLRQRSVLAALLVDVNRTVTVDRLGDRIWGDRPPQRWRPTLYSYVSRLRHALETACDDEVCIRRQLGGYQLVGDSATVDLHRFRELVARARRAEEDDQAAALFDQALGLWRGSAFGALETPWFTELRETLHREQLTAELDRNDIALRRGRHTDVLARLFEQVAVHPLDERLAGQLMLALHRSGRSADALEHYQRMRRRLAEELGIDPSPPLRRLHQQVLAADASLAVPVRPSAAVLSAPVPRQMPAPPALFTGRDEELEQLSKSLGNGPDGTMATTVICGPGGVGKSWLAAQWANRNIQRFPDGQLYVNLHGFDPRTSPLSAQVALRGFLEALGVAHDRVPTDCEAQSALYRSLLAERRMLVFLDDARDADQVRPLLPGSPLCTVLVTSRSRLTALMTAHGARLLPLDILGPEEAHALLAGRLGAERTSAEPEAVAALVEHCAGLPLALGVVAARAATHPDFRLAVLAEELVRAADRLTALDPGDLTLNVRAVFAASHQALSSSAGRLFSLLGLAEGPDIGLAAAASLAELPSAQVRALLTELETAHLVKQYRPGRYRMHDLIRLYAAELADGLPEREARSAQSRLLDHYLHTAFAANRLLDGPYTPFRPEPDPPASGSRPVRLSDTAAALQWFHDEHECLLAAQSQAAVLGRHRVVWQLAWTLISYQLGGHRLQEYATVWHAALAAAEHDGDDFTAKTLAHWRLGFASARAGDHAQALDHLRIALTLAENTGDTAGQAHIHRTLGRAWEERGDNDRALGHAVRALRLYQKVDHPLWQANQLNAVGWMHAQLGQYTEAQAHCEQALALFRAEGLPAHGASTLDSLGYIAHHTGRYQDALNHYEQALALFREAGDTAHEADTLVNAGETHRSLHHDVDARDAWQRALELYRSQNRTAEADRLCDRLRTLGAP
ncbi:AfsR/SARP family transcriptional regulator [Streptomyces minutiscleroticus]|uniref:AfsR/SARP family transcriptional regulator n=1 Tax=Streptomyces minutiscleroticus TaxID=68238 RepID=UPI00167D5723|nr:BTAD domain-containing putative transcriptional regulator [Streptomyces minutiscleroticus]